MTLSSFGGGLTTSFITADFSENYTSQVIDAADEIVAFILQIGKDGTLAKIRFRTGTVTTGATVLVRVESVATDGHPSGTLLAANSEGTQVVDATDDDTGFLVTLTTGPSVTEGQFVAIVIQNPSSSFGNMQIAVGRGENLNFPVVDLFTSFWGKKVDQVPCVGLEYDDGSYAWIGKTYPCGAYNLQSYDNATTPDERGILMNFPFPVTISGLWVKADIDGNTDFVLYDSVDTELSSLTVDEDLGSTPNHLTWVFKFDEAVDLAANADYRLTGKPTTTNNIAFSEYTVDVAAQWDQTDLGQLFYLTTRTDAGAWTDDVLTKPLMGPIFSRVDDGAGGGGGGGFPLIGVGKGLIG